MKTISVVAAVIIDADIVFATARSYGEYKGWWEFPGGKVEVGETPEEARWLTRDTIDDVRWLPADITILEKIKKKL